jgi:hypothetical protein
MTTLVNLTRSHTLLCCYCCRFYRPDGAWYGCDRICVAFVQCNYTSSITFWQSQKMWMLNCSRLGVNTFCKNNP